MATKRALKRSVEFLANDLITTQYLKNSIAGADDQKTSELIVETIAMQREVKAMIQHYNRKASAKEVKAEFKKIQAALLEKFNAIADATNKLA